MSPAASAAAASGGGAVRAPNGPRRLVLWFRNDLRLHDNAVVAEAVRAVRGAAVRFCAAALGCGAPHPTPIPMSALSHAWCGGVRRDGS